MKASFDFYGTLTRPDVQDFAVELLKKGVTVFVVTSRFNELLKEVYTKNPINDELWALVGYLGISERNVIFTNMKYKHELFEDEIDLAFHLDDDKDEILSAEIHHCPVNFIDVNHKSWREQCEKLLNHA